jgi:threonine/homoserine/homoserine lactone efflux protein
MGEALRNYLLGIALAAPIGPASITVIKTGLRWGFMRAFPTGLGITTADLTYMLIVYFGLANFVAIPVVKIAIWSVGTIVLLYLGVQSLREGGRNVDLDDSSVNSSRNPFLVGYLVNISNPLAVVFWLGIFGSIVSEVSATGIHPLLKGACILLGILTWHTMMSILTHWGKRFINLKTARIISIIAGVALLIFGLRFFYNVIVGIMAR